MAASGGRAAGLAASGGGPWPRRLVGRLRRGRRADLSRSCQPSPREAAETDWQTIAHWKGLENQYPRGLGVNWLDLGRTVSTRAIRLRITQATGKATRT